uniref:Mei2-like C-terminal RNA recognition motif domain-containing protein n=1 Tax=Alexandrium monilatum TaxID=311494 RepID=A0A6T0XNP3_9DINO
MVAEADCLPQLSLPASLFLSGVRSEVFCRGQPRLPHGSAAERLAGEDPSCRPPRLRCHRGHGGDEPSRKPRQRAGEHGAQALPAGEYVPMDVKTRAGFGYAFVNLVSATVVPNFWHVFDGFHKWMFPCQKVCRVSWSTPLQGLQAHLSRYRP